MKRTTMLAALLATLAAAFASVAFAQPAGPKDELKAVKDATSRFHSYKQAKRAGYSAKGEPCVSAEPGSGLTGAMGVHAVNAELARDQAIDPLRPEVLVYLPRRNGRLRLVAVEYFAVALAKTEQAPKPWFEDTPPPDGFVGEAPSVLGRKLDGPMPGHNPSMPWHYDLHVWLFAENPAGVFAPFNPALRCPTARG